jgi:hypothetical protein
MTQVVTKENVVEILNEIANEYNISVVETTIGTNGYPSNLQFALTDFESYEQYCEIKDKYNLQEISLHKKDGWQLYNRKSTYNNTPYTAYDFAEVESTSAYEVRCWTNSDIDNFIDFQLEQELKNDKFYDLIPTEYFKDVKDWSEIPELLEKFESQLDFHTIELGESENDFAYTYETLRTIQKWWESKNKIIEKLKTLSNTKAILEYPDDYTITDLYMCGYYSDTNYYQFGLFYCYEDLPNEE